MQINQFNIKNSIIVNRILRVSRVVNSKGKSTARLSHLIVFFSASQAEVYLLLGEMWVQLITFNCHALRLKTRGLGSNFHLI
jgi:hypothetical protein